MEVIRPKLFLFPLLVMFGLFLAMSQPAEAVPASPRVHTLRQADGTTFAARQWGDERLHGWETLEGYTIIFNRATGNWHYATLDAEGRLVPSHRVVGWDQPPPGVPKYLRPQRRGPAPEGRKGPEFKPPLPRGNSQQVVPPSGIASLPVILINFTDTATTYTPPQFDTLLFGTGNNSMSDYYAEVSYFNFTVDGDVFGWYTAAKNHDYYGVNDAKGNDKWPGDLVYEAVQAADPTVDFSLYDNDGDCYVDVVAIVHQGTGEDDSGVATDIWAHQWSLNKAKNAGYSHYGEYTTDDSCPGGGQIKVNDYTMQAEQLKDGGIATIGAFCHEFGHALGLPDLYDTDDSSEGIGNWGLMGGGSWNRVARSGDRPAHLSAWSKYRLGWVTPTQVVGTLPDEPIEPASQDADVYQLLYGSPDTGGEYFLIENRQQLGFDAGLPGAGLLIWHIEENKTKNTEECYPPSNCATTHYKVALMQADNRWDLEKNQNRGDAGDPYPGSSNNTSFNDSSAPASKVWDGRSSNAGVINIYQSGATMYATLFAPAPWAKAYVGSYIGAGDYDYARSIQQTTDGGYIMAGATNTFGVSSYDYDVWVLKLDASGAVQWQKTYGGPDVDTAYAIQQTADGGYIVAGETYSFGSYPYSDIWILKLDVMGDIEWQKTYGGDRDEVAYSIQETRDQDYIVAGVTSSFGVDANDVWVLKLDADGRVQWQKTYGGGETDLAYAIQQTTDGGYIVAGWSDSLYPGRSDPGFWVLKLAPNGTVQWQRTYGTDRGSEYAYSIQQTSDGGYIVAGETDSFGGGVTDYNIWVLKLDGNGNIPGCPVQGTLNAVLRDTSAVVSNSSVIPSGTSISPLDTSVSPSDTNASTWEVCLVQQQYTLTVTKNGTGTGTVTSNPAGIDCGQDCTQDYLEGTLVTLTATPDPDSSFAGWSGDCTDIGNNQAQVTMDADKTCTATFTLVSGLELSLNQSSFQTGDTLILTATVIPGATPQRVDVYVALRLPNGIRLFLQWDGRLIRAARPLVRNWLVTSFHGELFRHTFRGTEPDGDYTWKGAFTEAGTRRVIGEISQAPFSFTP